MLFDALYGDSGTAEPGGMNMGPLPPVPPPPLSRLRSLVVLKAYARAWQVGIDGHRTLKQKQYSSYTAYSDRQWLANSNPNMAIPEVRPVGKGDPHSNIKIW